MDGFVSFVPLAIAGATLLFTAYTLLAKSNAEDEFILALSKAMVTRLENYSQERRITIDDLIGRSFDFGVRDSTENISYGSGALRSIFNDLIGLDYKDASSIVIMALDEMKEREKNIIISILDNNTIHGRERYLNKLLTKAIEQIMKTPTMQLH